MVGPVPPPAPALPPPSADPETLFTFIVAWFPIALIIGLWFWFLRRLGASKYKDHITRSIEHMERVERQNEEVLSILRAIKSELRGRRE
jgi:hypothetical protein